MRKITPLISASLVVVTLGAGLPVSTAQAASKHPVPKALRGTWKSVNHPKTRQMHLGKDYIFQRINHAFDLGIYKAKSVKLSKNTYRLSGYSFNSGKSSGNIHQSFTVKKQGHRIGIKGVSDGISTKYVTWFYK